MSTTERIRRLIKEADELLKQLGTAACVLLALSLTACGGDRDGQDLTLRGVDQTKPGVLIFGDSVSLGYTPFVAQARPDLNVLHTEANNMGSGNGVRTVEVVLQQRQRWSVVVFNHGHWDQPGNEQATSLAEYASNLTAEVAIMRRYADRVVFVTSTEVSAPFVSFSNQDVSERNAAAVQVMNELGIQVIDLYAVSAGMPGLHNDGIHWTDAGSAVLSQSIINYLNL